MLRTDLSDEVIISRIKEFLEQIDVDLSQCAKPNYGE